MSIKEPPLEDSDIDWYVSEGLLDMNELHDNYMDEKGLSEYVMNLIEEKFNLIDSQESLEEIQIRVNKKCVEKINEDC
jgi:hypothetical protein